MTAPLRPSPHTADGTWFIGLMSGTSTDGVDAVLARLRDDHPPECIAMASIGFPAALRDTLLALNTPGADELHRAALAANELVQCYAQAVADVLRQTGMPASAITAIGAHGQTVRHRPELGYTLQINAPARLAELTGISVVSDFRSRDVAAGGQGAPLVPAFHAEIFASDLTQVILNLGGIANITVLEPGVMPKGFDTGPSNVLLDLWCARHLDKAYDENGAWAASGQSNPALLAYLLASEPWFDRAPPKSTGRDLFNATWLDERLAHFQSTHARMAAEDVQATLSVLTATSVANAISRWASPPDQLWVAGGGAMNPTLLRDLATALRIPVVTTDQRGVPTQAVEALAFAWLARAYCTGRAGNFPGVTGAAGPRVLGQYNPA